VDRMTEEQMLEMALKQSLESSNGGGESSRQSTIVDPDSLTKSPMPKTKQLPTHSLVEAADAPTPGAGQGQGQQPAATEESVFARISSSSPHEEPKNDPATTTRIQFRHATGRIIRRFNTQDRVERIYEWLKAEPMEGKDGVEFELKKMPQGQDLLESLDMTVEAAGLKQGTVMIEFVD
jgi:UBX domain-containing protein 7